VGGRRRGRDQTVEGRGPARHAHRAAQPDLEAADERVDLVVGDRAALRHDSGDPLRDSGTEGVDDATRVGGSIAAQQVRCLAVDAHRLASSRSRPGRSGGLDRLRPGQTGEPYLRRGREQAYPEARLGGGVVEVLEQERSPVGIRGVLEQPDDVGVDLGGRVVQRPRPMAVSAGALRGWAARRISDWSRRVNSSPTWTDTSRERRRISASQSTLRMSHSSRFWRNPVSRSQS
jgi:hypothetical protein